MIRKEHAISKAKKIRDDLQALITATTDRETRSALERAKAELEYAEDLISLQDEERND